MVSSMISRKRSSKSPKLAIESSFVVVECGDGPPPEPVDARLVRRVSRDSFSLEAMSREGDAPAEGEGCAFSDESWENRLADHGSSDIFIGLLDTELLSVSLGFRRLLGEGLFWVRNIDREAVGDPMWLGVSL